MPTDQYICPKCELEHLEERSITEKEKELTCAAKGCGGNLKRVFTAPPIQFKGSGFSSSRG